MARLVSTADEARSGAGERGEAAVRTARVAVTMAAVLATALAAATPVGCDSPGGGVAPDSGTVTLRADEGVDLATGAWQEKGNYASSDLYATNNGSGGLKLAPGGDTPTHSRPVEWFQTSGGVYQTFPSLEAVPATLPTGSASGLPLPHVKSHNGVVVKISTGGYVRGWVEQADAESLTLQWARVPAE